MAHATPLSEFLRQQIAKLIAANGERATVARLEVGRQTLAPALAGLALYPGTQALIRQRLDQLDAEDARLRWRPDASFASTAEGGRPEMKTR